jgi:hypothetical protein
MARPPSPRSAPARPKPPTISELRREVLTLVGVSSTRELKRSNQDLRHLDFRLKASWSTALQVLQQAAAAYPDWDSHPPEAFRELFAAIDQASEAYDHAIDEGLRLSAQLQKAADDLESLSGELLEEVGELRTVQTASRRQARQRRFN